MEDALPYGSHSSRLEIENSGSEVSERKRRSMKGEFNEDT
jgi:hypothetical protein